MPLVEITLIAGRSGEQKRAVMREVTEVIARNLEAAPASIRVILREVPGCHWAVGGEPKGEFPPDG